MDSSNQDPSLAKFRPSARLLVFTGSVVFCEALCAPLLPECRQADATSLRLSAKHENKINESLTKTILIPYKSIIIDIISYHRIHIQIPWPRIGACSLPYQVLLSMSLALI